MTDDAAKKQSLRLEQMPTAELRTLAEQLMLRPEGKAGRNELAASLEERLALIDRLDRQTMLDVVIWGRRPVARSAGKIDLVREISQINFGNYEGLDVEGLSTIARLRGFTVPAVVTDKQLRSLLTRDEGLGGWIARKRRAIVAGVVGKLLDDGEHGEYQFLPEDSSGDTLRKQIKQQGVVGGIASKLRTAADGYIDTKLDEIDARIDQKLEQIDERLAEWRDREIANRLQIIKMTLIASIVVGIVSLVYTYIRTKM